MPETDAFRRHPDGSIDMDFYRARAVGHRRAQLARTGRAWGRSLRRLFATRADGRERPTTLRLAAVRRAGRNDRT